MSTSRSKTPRRADAAQTDATAASSCPAPAAAGALAVQSPAARPVINVVQLTGSSNIVNLGGCQMIGSNQYLQGSGNVGAGADTIRALSDTIAAQQRTIDHLITMLERLTAAQR